MNSYYKRIKRYKKELHLDDNPQGFLCDDEDRAIINVGAENYDDVFSPYCFKGGDTLPLELVSYLNQKANTIPLDYDLVIRFHVKQASEEKRREIKAAVRENYKNDIRSIDRKMNRTFVFTLW